MFKFLIKATQLNKLTF